MTRARNVTRRTWLVRLYPVGWRERYEDEFVAMLEDARPSLTDYADILLGALDARLFLRDTTGGTLTMLTRYRAANVAVFCSWILFVLAGLALNGMLDDSAYVPLMRERADLHTAWLVLQAGAVISLLAVLAGGLPIALAVWRNSPAQRRWFLVPAICFLLVAAPVAVAVILTVTGVVQPVTTPPSWGHPAVIGYQILFILCAAASTYAVTRAVRLGSVGEETYRFALIPAIVTVGAMALMLGATVVWGLLASATLPDVFYRAPGAWPSNLTFASWLIVVIVMSLATAVGAIALLRGFAAQSGDSQSPALA
ncbi:MAG TPA: hypothetical protein VH393_12575 [Ktedonobacterales bacterium]|jgi:hypothetical protein